MEYSSVAIYAPLDQPLFHMHKMQSTAHNVHDSFSGSSVGAADEVVHLIAPISV